MTISNIVGCTGSLILVLLASTMVPFIGPFVSLLTPLPFLFYLCKLGPGNGIKVCFVALLIIGIATKLLGQPHLVIFCLEFGIMGLILSELFRREFPYSITILWGTLLMLLVGSVFMLFVSMTKGATPVEMVVTYLQVNLDTAIDMYEKEGLNPEMVEQLKNIGPIITALIKKIYPSLIVIGTGFIIWVNIVVSKPLFRLKGVKYPDLGRADMWKAPEYLVWVLIAAGFSKFLSVSALDFTATNALIIISVVYAFHGLSIVLFFLNKYNANVWTRVIIFSLIAFQSLFMIVLAVMGLFDQWVDFRKINIRRAQTPE